MPRVARIKSETGVYHAMARGINRQDIFQDSKDRILFLEKLEAVKKRSGCLIYAYCLMRNHVHLLIVEKLESIGQIMRRLGSAYAYWYNKKYGRVGHLFQGRFLSEPVDVDTYLLTALRYIHQNPVKAGLVNSCAGYPWSSFNDYMNPGKSVKKITDTKVVLEIVGGTRQFYEFHQKPCDNDLLDIDDVTPVTDAQAKQLIQQVLDNITADDLLQMPIDERNRFLRELKALPGINQKQIVRVTGISRNIVQRA
ncbi:MAG: transposase [Firmicutes bacterium]|mgnify:CR=1 FL=1|nr:transposase [Bacillota bacterium]